MTEALPISADRLRQRREHLMSEIELLQKAGQHQHALSPSLRAPGHRRLWIAIPGGLAAAATAGMLAVTMLGGPGGATGPAAFAMQNISRDTISVKIVNNQVAAHDMTEQLHQRGLNITVTSVPVSPQLIGTWVGSAFSADVPETVAQTVIDQMSGYSSTIELPASFTGEITLNTGHATDPGQEPKVIASPNALAPSGRLGCLHATGTAPATLQQQAEELGYTVTWANGDDRETPAIPGPQPGQRVVEAHIQDATPSTVQVTVATPTSHGYEARSHRGYSPQQWKTHTTNAASCTPA
jgi:hypothetical protein